MVVGWPAADWALVEPLLHSNQLPHLASLLGRGCFVSLASPPPQSHAAAWTTLATGLLADRHGVLADAEIRPDGGGVQPSGRRSWQAPAFWEVLDGAGLSTICVGWPATAPAACWPGIHIDERFAVATGSDFDTWAMPPDAVAPATLRDALRDLRIHPADGLQSQVLSLLPEISEIDPRLDQRPLLLQATLAQVGTVHSIATHQADGAWNVLCVCHDLLRLIANHQVAGDTEDGRYARLLTRAYVFQDMMLGRLIQLAGPNTVVMVVSAGATSQDLVATPGFLVAAGPRIATGVTQSAALTDFAPSVLAHFGLCCEVDGTPIAALFPTQIQLNHVPRLAKKLPRVATVILAGDFPDVIDSRQMSVLEQCTGERALNLAEVQMARGAVSESAATLEKLLEAQPRNIVSMQRLVECRALQGDADGCLPLAQALLETDPHSGWGHLAMGAWCVLSHDEAGAELHLERASHFGGDDIRVQLRLGGLHLLCGHSEKAARSFQTILARVPWQADALYGLGVTLAAKGDLAAAEVALRQSIVRQQVQPLAYLQLAAVLSAQARWQESIAVLTTIRRQHSRLPGLDVMLVEAQAGMAQQMVSEVVRRAGRNNSP